MRLGMCGVCLTVSTCGAAQSYELGYSHCRFPDCPHFRNDAEGQATGTRGMGCCNLTDGVYVWPEGLHHYVAEHAGTSLWAPPPDALRVTAALSQALRPCPLDSQ